ncbi:imelysin family protein [Chitinimonas naiadis]
MLRRTLLALPLTTVLIGAASAAELDASATVANWQAQQLPRIQALNEGGKALNDSMAALCLRKTTGNIDAARRAWQQTYQAWRAVESLPSGPILSRRTAWQIDVWPAKPAKVEEAVRLVEKDAAIADSVGAAAQGLPALEYLLWGDDRAQAQLGRLQFRQRCEYAAALATEIATESDGLLKEWQSYAATPLDHDAGRQAFEEGVNLLAASLEALRDKKLAHLGSAKQSKQLSRQEFDGWRSRSTRAGLEATLDAIEGLFFIARKGQSFADQLVQADKPILVRRLREEFATSRSLLAKLPADLAGSLAANPALAQPLLDSFKHLQQLVELQVADAVGVTIGFKDSDGD